MRTTDNKQWSLGEAFATFFKMGLFTIGGGYAMIPLMEKEIVEERHWIDRDEFLDLMAVAQSAPGVFAVNISIFIGYKMAGVKGSIACATGNVLPSILIILLIALGFRHFKDNALVSMVVNFFLLISLLFNATTIGIPNSNNWVVKNKLRLKLVASTMFTITSGFSF